MSNELGICLVQLDDFDYIEIDVEIAFLSAIEPEILLLRVYCLNWPPSCFCSCSVYILISYYVNVRRATRRIRNSRETAIGIKFLSNREAEIFLLPVSCRRHLVFGMLH